MTKRGGGCQPWQAKLTEKEQEELTRIETRMTAVRESLQKLIWARRLIQNRAVKRCLREEDR